MKYYAHPSKLQNLAHTVKRTTTKGGNCGALPLEDFDVAPVVLSSFFTKFNCTACAQKLPFPSFRSTLHSVTLYGRNN